MWSAHTHRTLHNQKYVKICYHYHKFNDRSSSEEITFIPNAAKDEIRGNSVGDYYVQALLIIIKVFIS